MNFKFVPLLLLLSLFIGCSEEPPLESSETSNESYSTTQSSQQRPFKLRSHGSFQMVSSSECLPLSQIALTGTGNGTHLGRFDASIIWCTDFGSEFYLTGTLTAANGDEIEFYSVDFGQSSEGQYGDYIFEGGTGRFADCYGEMRIYTTIVNTGQGEGTYSNYGDGYIIY